MKFFPLNQKHAQFFLRISFFSICGLITLGIVVAIIYGEYNEPLGQALLVTQGISLFFTLMFELSILVLLIDAYYFLQQRQLISFEKTLFLILGNAIAAYWFYYKKSKHKETLPLINSNQNQ
jgi:hypothetical protein